MAGPEEPACPSPMMKLVGTECYCPKGFKMNNSGDECIESTDIEEDHCHEECMRGECIDQKLADPNFVGVKEGKGIYVCMICNEGWKVNPEDPS